MSARCNSQSLKNTGRTAVLGASELRAQMVRAGDLRNEIGFQNDINILLAALDDGSSVWSLEAPLLSPDRAAAYDDGPPTLSDLQATSESVADAGFFEPYAA